MMPVCWIGIGSNVGDCRTAFDAAWWHLSQIPGTRMGLRSGFYRTQPVGANAGDAFINAAFSLSTECPPLELLDWLQSVETSLGRTRDVRWGPRTVDLDLLFVEDQILSNPRLSLPHPSAWYRRFVLDPLAEIAPLMRHPVLNETISELRDRFGQRPLVIAVEESSPDFQRRWASEMSARFPSVRLTAPDETAQEPAACLHLASREFAISSVSNGFTNDGIPLADLTSAPGDAVQRVSDFLIAVLDEPIRVGDW
jgi:2-amino-4-hydroxy-6-hydroxymethyldihydropteridine diphosphokinase